MHPLLRFTLNLFESNRPVTPVNQASSAIKDEVSAPVKTGQSTLLHGLSQTLFLHPEANCEVRLGEVFVAYEFKRVKRSSIGFSVGSKGLVVRAPNWVTLREVDAALQTKSKWILRKLQEFHSRLTEHGPDWRDGGRFNYLGQAVTLQLDPLHRLAPPGVPWMQEVQVQNPVTDETQRQILHLGLANNASADQMREAVQAWQKRQAKQVFQDRLNHFAPLLGVQWHKLTLSNAATRWGSANTKGEIRLNWQLIQYQMPVIDYVVAHELSHLRVMNHSARFWDTVRSVVPDYVLLQQQLKGHTH